MKQEKLWNKSSSKMVKPYSEIFSHPPICIELNVAGWSNNGHLIFRKFQTSLSVRCKLRDGGPIFSWSPA